MQKMGRYRVGDFEPKRSPDPILNHAAFAANVLSNAHKPAFNKPLAEVLLNQDYFNGTAFDSAKFRLLHDHLTTDNPGSV